MTYLKGETPCNWCEAGNHYKCKKLRYCSCNCPNEFSKIQHNNQNTKKKICRRNHLLDINNVYISKDGKRICKECVKIRRMNNIDKIRETARKHYQLYKNEYKLIRRVMNKSIYEKLKIEVLTYYGNGILACVCCGESISQMLTIDHIDNNGALERKIVHRTGHNMYRRLKKLKFPLGYQTLCFNCNSGKEINKGICPHKTIINKLKEESINPKILASFAKAGDIHG